MTDSQISGDERSWSTYWYRDSSGASFCTPSSTFSPTLTGTAAFLPFGTSTGTSSPLSAPGALPSLTVAWSQSAGLSAHGLIDTTVPLAPVCSAAGTFRSPPGHITTIAITAAAISGISSAATTIRTRRATTASASTTEVSTTLSPCP
jgi:hypothetical protein